MTAAVIGIAAAVVMAVFAVGAFYIVHIERRARKGAEKEQAEIREHERERTEAITDANAKKEELQSGDNRADFDATVGVLHDYAQKRR